MKAIKYKNIGKHILKFPKLIDLFKRKNYFYEQAKLSYEKAIELEPNVYFYAHYNLSFCIIEL